MAQRSGNNEFANTRELMKLNKAIGAIESQISTLTDLQQHNCEVSNARDDEILMELKAYRSDIETQMSACSIKVHERLDAHSQYHKENEKKFGIPALIREKPKYVFLVGLFVGSIVFAGFGFSVGQVAKYILAFFGVKLP